MSPSRPLPDVAVLEKLLLGQLPPDEAEALCAQLQDNQQFAALAQSLVASDTLIEALHAQITQPTPRPDARLEGLMARLCKLRPDLSGADADRTAALDPVSAGTPITFLSPAQQSDEMGRLGEYRVLKVLGQGGMGVVFLAEDVRLGRRVALKTMRPEAAQMANAKQRFIREARTTAAIEHDHIIPIYQVGEENGVPFLAMPFLRGEPLDERLKRAEGKPLPVREIVRIGREIAEGLAAAHEQGLIHRDIKPANIWLEGERGRVKVLDFGLARAAREDTQLTQSGAIVGTPAYMAPEQARGEAVDPRCDLFSLGCLLYQMATGRKPFNGPDTMSVLMSLALDQPAPPRQDNAELSAELSDLITRLLAKKPEDRPASARAVADALAAMERGPCETTLVQTASIAPIVAMPKPARPRRRLAVAIGAAMLLIGGVIAAVVIIRDKQGKEVARVNVPEDGSVEVKPDDKQRLPEKEKEQSDKDKPFVLLRDNKELRAFKTIYSAFNEMQNGDTIEVHGNGPFPLGLVRLQGKDLNLRAAPGYRPAFVPSRPLDQREHAWFEIKDGALNIVDCDFRQPTNCIVFAGGGKPWELRNCRILCASVLAEYSGTRLRMADSLAYGALWLGPKVELELDNNILRLETHQSMALQTPGGQAVRLRNNTIHLANNSGALFTLRDAKSVSVEATGNIVLFSNDYHRYLFSIPPTDVRDRVRWSGRHNLYAGLVV